jgi:hypothetical protein
MPPGLAVRLQSVCSNKLHHCFMAQHGMAYHKRQEQDQAHIGLTSGSHQARTRHHDQKAGKAPSVRWRQQRQRIARRHRRTASQDGSAAQDKRQERKLDNDNDNDKHACLWRYSRCRCICRHSERHPRQRQRRRQQFGCRARAAGEVRATFGTYRIGPGGGPRTAKWQCVSNVCVMFLTVPRNKAGPRQEQGSRNFATTAGQVQYFR